MCLRFKQGHNEGAVIDSLKELNDEWKVVRESVNTLSMLVGADGGPKDGGRWTTATATPNPPTAAYHRRHHPLLFTFSFSQFISSASPQGGKKHSITTMAFHTQVKAVRYTTGILHFHINIYIYI